MAHFASQPLPRPLLSPSLAGQWRAMDALPDAYDTRYPRRWWQRALRLVASAWWAPVIVYLMQALTVVARAEQAERFAAAPDGGLVARALRVDWVPAFVLEQPAGLVLVVAGLTVLLFALAGGIAAGRWAAADRRREAEVLIVRLARPEERFDVAFVQRALAPALAWQLRTARVRRRITILLLVGVAVVAGVLLALGGPPPGQ
jgi:hypothetical protein